MLSSALKKLLKMNGYLREAKALVEAGACKPVLAVIGNESVDLDSAISAICLAYHLSKVKTNSHIIPLAMRSEHIVVVPVINAIRLNLPLKTEVTHWLQKHQIELDNLVCRDEINLSVKVAHFALVDHHVSEFRQKVISVLDHRPCNEKSNLNSDCYINIQEVGSCATLVSDAIRKDQSGDALKEHYQEVFRLLYGTIVLDTINFSEKADKVRPLDVENAEFIESFLNIEDVAQHRKALYDELVAARADVSSLNSLQLLSKDLKIISGVNGTVAIPGVDVFEYIDMEKAAERVEKFAVRENVDVVVLMGLVPVGDSVERYLGFINIKNETLFARVSFIK